MLENNRLAFFTLLAASFVAGCGSADDASDGGSGGGSAVISVVAGSGVSVTTSSTTATGSTGSSGATTTSAASGSGGGFIQAPHPAVAQVVDLGGSVLTSPKVRPILYPGDPSTGDVQPFLQAMASSQYWQAITADYGVGPLTVLPTFTMPENAGSTVDATEFLNLLDQETQNGDWGAADPETIYMLLLPPGSVVSDGGSTCCGDYEGFHNEVELAGGKVPYAIVCQCQDLDDATSIMSHEIIEASTDPFWVTTSGAFARADDDHAAYTVISEGEVGDMCEYNLDAYYTLPGTNYVAQRSWSNSAAMAGKDPCVPHTGHDPYFNAAPVVDDDVSVYLYSDSTSTVVTKGVSIPVGGSKTIEVDLFSDGPVGEWNVSAFDVGSYFDGGSPYLDFAWDKTTGKNGDKLHLTITVLEADESTGGEMFWVESQLDGQDNLWMGIVAN